MYNLIAYITYLFFVVAIVTLAGGFLYRNGKFYLEEIFHDEHIVRSVNRFLYTGYCLVNVGGAFRCLYVAGTIDNTKKLLEYVADNTGQLLLLLGCMHAVNLGVLPLLKKIFKRINKPMLNPKTNTHENL